MIFKKDINTLYFDVVKLIFKRDITNFILIVVKFDHTTVICVTLLNFLSLVQQKLIKNNFKLY